MYKRGMTKEKFTGKMRYFWTTHWKYGTVDTWVKLTMDKVHRKIIKERSGEENPRDAQVT